jgi:hypothetical protein
MSSDPKWDEARKREKAFHQERLKAIVDDEKLLDPKTDLFQKYEDAGDRLKRNEYTDKEDRKYDIDLRRAILGLKPNIRFDETTGKLRSSQAKQFNIVVHDVSGNRFVCYAHSKDTPTIFKYPYVSGETRIGTPRALLAYMAQEKLITDDTLLVQATGMATYGAFLQGMFK